MEILVLVGATVSVLGIVGILVSILQVRRARRETTDDAALRARIQAILPLNLGAFLLSVLGLMCVVVGVLLG